MAPILGATQCVSPPSPSVHVRRRLLPTLSRVLPASQLIRLVWMPRVAGDDPRSRRYQRRLAAGAFRELVGRPRRQREISTRRLRPRPPPTPTPPPPLQSPLRAAAPPPGFWLSPTSRFTAREVYATLPWDGRARREAARRRPNAPSSPRHQRASLRRHPAG